MGRGLRAGGPRTGRAAAMTAGEVRAGLRAAIVAIGNEMLGPLRQDTNSLWITARLEDLGIPVVRKSIVPDNPDAIGRELSFVAQNANLVFTTGGLGPTADDVTVPAIARALGLSLSRNEPYLARMRQRFER